MDNSVYVVLSRQTALFRKMDIIANNIANADSAGFQAEKIMFTDYLVDDGNHKKIAFTQDISSYRDTSEGRLKKTGNLLDVAISGDGYFRVGTPAGERYTRAGEFKKNDTGMLVTTDNFPVLDDGGQPIIFPNTKGNITIGEAGNISINGEEIANLGVAEFANTQKMTQVGRALFKVTGDILPAINSRVLQGILEKSNVEGIREIVDMTKTSRSTASTAKFIEVIYDLQRKANNAYVRRG